MGQRSDSEREADTQRSTAEWLSPHWTAISFDVVGVFPSGILGSSVSRWSIAKRAPVDRC